MKIGNYMAAATVSVYNHCLLIKTMEITMLLMQLNGANVLD